MNKKRTVLIIILLLAALSSAGAVSYRKLDIILKKAIRSYRNIPSSDIKWKVLGRSNWKNRIYFQEFGSGEKLTLIIGGLHGDEPCGVLSTLKLAGYLKKNPDSIQSRVIIIPCINPDGLLVGRRTNGRRIDINRNFPTKTWSAEYKKSYNNSGPLPASEPETVLLANVIDEYKPDLIIQMHQPFNALYPDGDTPMELLEKMSEITGLPVSNDIGYPTPGSLGTYASSLELNIKGITYEMGPIDREPDYNRITESLIEAINYPK